MGYWRHGARAHLAADRALALVDQLPDVGLAALQIPDQVLVQQLLSAHLGEVPSLNEVQAYPLRFQGWRQA